MLLHGDSVILVCSNASLRSYRFPTLWYVPLNLYTMSCKQGWKDISSDKVGHGAKMELAGFRSTDKGPIVQFVLSVVEDFRWQLHIYGLTLSHQSPVMASFPPLLKSVSGVRDICLFVDNCTLCCGNWDNKYLPLADARKGKFMDISGKCLP